MSIMPSPIILLGSFVAAFMLFLSGFFYGKHIERSEQALNITSIQKQTIADANRDIEIETQRALAFAAQETKKRISFQILKLKGERDAALKAKSDCSRDPASMGVLLDTIRSVNGEEAAPN